MKKTLTCQLPLRPALPTVYGPVDYREFRTLLERIDILLQASGLTQRFIQLSRQHKEATTAKPVTNPHFASQCECALRCNIARILSAEGYRKFARRLADSQLLQWFCKVQEMDKIKPPSKSTLQRYAHCLPTSQIDELIYDLLRQCGAPSDESQPHPLGFEEPVSFDEAYLDSTCLQANIHFPVDWVLLIDAVRSLMKATLVIRKHGLKHRMRPPEKFIQEINTLGMAMTGAYRKVDSKKKRKKLLRSMKQVVRKVSLHAEKHRDLLSKHWAQSKLSQAQANQIITRIESILTQLPRAQKQAHERIIGERQVANEDKLLSLYESDVQVIKRGKAGGAVEFGNLLSLVEQANGLLIGWQLHAELSSDQNDLPRQMDTVESGLDKRCKRLFTDRGYVSANNDDYLQKKGIYNGICPKAPGELTRRSRSHVFVRGQKRRAQTEGRIGIFKNAFLGKPLRSQGFKRREQAVSLCVLTHNLWVVARLLIEQDKERAARAA